MRFDDVSVVMATKNEEEAIGTVIDQIKEITNGEAEIVVVDGSEDKTPEIAEEKGARVIKQKPQGYGIAVKKALMSASNDIIITTDCDGTYPMEMIPEFVKKIKEGYDVVSGVRIKGFMGLKTNNMTKLNAFGNWIFAWLVTLLYFQRIHDTTTGMRAYKSEVIHSIEWKENTGLSAELLFKPILNDKKIFELEIPYRKRIGETKLDPLRGGSEILWTIIKYRLGILTIYLIVILTIIVAIILYQKVVL